MVFTSYDQIINNVIAGKFKKRWFWKFNEVTDQAGVPFMVWREAGIPGAGSAPSTNEAPNSSTTGAFEVGNPTNPDLSYFSKFGVATSASATTNGAAMIHLIDVLAWSAGLSGTSTAEQTTNLPTPSLTRYTGTASAGNRIALVCWTATGTTAANVTVKYTNQAGTANRTTPSIAFFTGIGSYGLTAPTADQIQFVPFQQDDTGVRSIESVTLSASTGTAGNFGVMIYRPIAQVMCSLEQYIEEDMIINFDAMLEKPNDSCFTFIVHPMTTNTVPVIYGQLMCVEG